MTQFVFLLAVGMFGLKLLWNILVPYALAIRAYRARDEQTSGISLMPGIEILLWIVAVALAFALNRAWPWSPLGVATLGGAAMVVSHVHLVVGGGIANWAVRVLRRRIGGELP